MIRTRFAPSPTGSLHVGNARIAVLNWLLTRHHGGRFVLRIEDTDADRNVEEAERGMFEDLRWLGLEWDEGPDKGGDFGPYRQSERLERYLDEARGLENRGLAYPCYCTPEELEARREAALAEGRPPHYDGACRTLTASARSRLESEGRTPALRFRVPDGKPVHIHDAVRGEITVDRNDLGDFVILRSDGVPTYNFAVVVDDAAMEITHVIRGAGHLSNTPRQALLFDALRHERPTFVHVPTVLAPDRHKLSKRHGARALAEYRAQGYHPDAMVNYLSLLAWSSPSGDEVLERDRLVREISIDRIGAADVVFDPDKLRWLSGRHISRMPLRAASPNGPAGLVEAVRPFLDENTRQALGNELDIVVEAVRSHLDTLQDIRDQVDPFLPGVDADGRRARAGLADDGGARRVLDAVRSALAGLDAWEPGSIKGTIRAAGAECGVKGRDLYVPVRLAVTGREHGPPLDAILAVQGRENVLKALDATRSGANAP